MPTSTRLRTGLIVGAALAAAVTGTLFFGQTRQLSLVLVDRDGRKTPVGFVPLHTFAPRISPDGKRAERLTMARAPESWSAPNQLISFITLSNYYSIWTYSLRDKKAAVLIDTPGVTQHSSRFSPDGKWIAYTSLETGRFEMFVQPFPRTGAKFQFTKQGGGHPLWSPDGKELFFDNNQQLFAVSVQTNGTFSSGTPVPMPIRGFIQGDARRQYDLMPDGKQFLMMFP